jgi:hypothetical protein
VRKRFDELVRGKPLSRPLAGGLFLLFGLETLVLGMMKK